MTDKGIVMNQESTNRPVKALFDQYEDAVEEAFDEEDYYGDDDTAEYNEQYLDEDYDYEVERDYES
jgi:hypothetical protein